MKQKTPAEEFYDRNVLKGVDSHHRLHICLLMTMYARECVAQEILRAKPNHTEEDERGWTITINEESYYVEFIPEQEVMSEEFVTHDHYEPADTREQVTITVVKTEAFEDDWKDHAPSKRIHDALTDYILTRYRGEWDEVNTLEFMIDRKIKESKENNHLLN